MWTFYGCNLEQLLVFQALRVSRQVHQSTSWTPPMRGQSMYAIQNNFSYLGLYKLVDECTRPSVEHLLCVDDPQLRGWGWGWGGGLMHLWNTTSCWDLIIDFLHIGPHAKKTRPRGHIYIYKYICMCPLYIYINIYTQVYHIVVGSIKYPI